METRIEEALRNIAKKARTKEAREPRINRHPEDDLQKRCVAWFRDCYSEEAPLLFHPNNEAYLGKGRTRLQQSIAGRRAKDMGVTAGVADLILLHPGKSGEHGLCIEMKSCRGHQEPAQKEWQEVVEKRGYRYTLCRGFEEFKQIIEEYIGMKPADQDEIAIKKLFGKDIRIHKTKDCQ